MNLKLRNTLISVGAVTLIGVAAAGLVVSLRKEKSYDVDASRNYIRSIIEEGWQIYTHVDDKHKEDTNPKELNASLIRFQARWALDERPGELYFDKTDEDLKPMFEQLKAMINVMYNPTME